MKIQIIMFKKKVFIYFTYSNFSPVNSIFPLIPDFRDFQSAAKTRYSSSFREMYAQSQLNQTSAKVRMCFDF